MRGDGWRIGLCRRWQNTSRDGKELHFFDRYPARGRAEFLSMWPQGERDAMLNGTSQKFLVDATPESLLNPVVPPRIKRMVPHAKIVVVLRV
jgi:hypothetical protein